MTQHMNMAAGSTLLIGLLVAFLVAPGGAHASSASAALGGGNALMRALESRSLGVTNANPVSEILSRLQFSSTNGGTENTGGAQSQDQQNGQSGQSGNSAGSGDDNAQNGGAQGGNGGDGGPGGVVRAGNTVTNSNALNVLNAILVRFNL